MWHVRFSETDIKRGTFEQLQALAAKGRILPTTPVRAPDSQKWVRAQSVPGLFPEPEESSGFESISDDPFASTASLGGHNPLAMPAKKANAGGGLDPKILLIGGIAGGGVLLLVIIIAVVMSMSGGDSTPIATVTPVTPTTSPGPSAPAVAPAPAIVTPPIVPAVVPVPSANTTPAVAPAVTPAVETKPATPATTEAPVIGPEPSTSTPAAASVEMTLTQLIAHVQPSIVRIDVLNSLGGAVGSGFVVDDKGTVVTNLHVVAGAKAARLSFSDKIEVDVTAVLAVSKEQDLAILQFDPKKVKIKPLPLAQQLPPAGERVAAFGAPKGLSFTTSDGIVSAVRSGDELKQFGADFSATMIQTSAPISPGNSGGPLVNMKGEVVGVNTVQLTSGQNLNFAVSCTDIKGMLIQAASGAAKPIAELAKYETPKQKPASFQDLEKQQKAALAIPENVEEEWVIGGGAPIKATIVSLSTTGKEPRKPKELDGKDFEAGKYKIPSGVKVRLKHADGTEKDYNLSQLGTAGIKKVHERWLAEAYAAIKLKLVQRGNDRMQGLFAAAHQKNEEQIKANIENIAMLYMFGDAAMPKEHAAHVRKLVEMNLEVIVTEGHQDNFARTLADVESQLKAKVKSNPAMQKAYANFMQEMLSGSS